MSSTDIINSTLDKVKAMWEAADIALNEWTSEENLQFPVLMGMVALRLNWTEEQVRAADPLVRFYVRNHPELEVSRGAKGGIQRKANKQKREALRQAKDAAKKQVKETLEAKLAAIDLESKNEG